MKLIEKLKGAHERPYVAYKVVGYYSPYQTMLKADSIIEWCVVGI